MIPTFLPPLKHMAAVSIAVLLFKTGDFKQFMEEMDELEIISELGKNENWDNMKKTTAEKMGDLLAPAIKNLVVEMLRPLVWEWQSWKVDHCMFYMYSPNKSILSQIVSWKSDGTIDRTKTAKSFIRDRRFLPQERFVMACIYFQENEIVELWDDVRNNLPSENINFVIRFWVRWLKQGCTVPWTDMVDQHLENPNHEFYDFQTNLRASCFFQALSSRNRQNYLAILGQSIVHSDDLRFCFYQMNESERIFLYHNCCQRILVSLLRWPFQTIFLQAAKNFWGYLKPEHFYFILELITIDFILKDLKYFNFLELFKEFWCASPESHKEYVTRNINFFKVVELLLSFDNKNRRFSLNEVMTMLESCEIFRFGSI